MRTKVMTARPAARKGNGSRTKKTVAVASRKSEKDVRSVTASGEYVTNAVRVTVTYRWSPGLFGDPLVVRGVCETPMAQ